MPRISGFTIVRNAIRLDFPLEASIRSILPICDEVVVNVGKSEDDTRELVRSISDPKIRLIETEWDLSLQSAVLSHETGRAMRHCRYSWGVYIQADEVLHEKGAADLHAAIEANDPRPRVEGLLVRYRHFYGDLETIAMSRRWYRREVRAVRLTPSADVRSYGDAQGFRIGPAHRKIRARLTDAEMFHYGWARPTHAIKAKRESNQAIYPWSAKREARAAEHPRLPWVPGLRRFDGTHPAVAHDWVEARREQVRDRIEQPHFRAEHLRLYGSDIIERLTGARVFEFRNYRRV